MALVTLNDILPQARKSKYAVGAFNVGNYETAVAVVRAAEAENKPVVVQVYSRLFSTGKAAQMAGMLRTLGEASSVPVALHLDHGESLEQVKTAIEIGFTSVMFDGSRLPLEENIAMTLKAVELARAAGISIEGEIGHVPMGDEMTISNFEETCIFAERSGVDVLAVSIGTSHGYYKEAPEINVELCRRIGDSVPMPLALHGGTGTPNEKIREVIDCGIAKVNIATEFQHLFLLAVREQFVEIGEKFMAVDLFMEPVIEKCADYVRGKIRALSQK